MTSVDIGAVAVAKVVEGFTLMQAHAEDNAEGAYDVPWVAHARGWTATSRLSGTVLVTMAGAVVVVVDFFTTRTVAVDIDVWTSVASAVVTVEVTVLPTSRCQKETLPGWRATSRLT